MNPTTSLISWAQAVRIKAAMRFSGTKVVQGDDQAAIAGAQRPLKIGKRNPAGNATGAAAIIKDNRGAELAALLQVKLQAIIARDGTIQELQVISGHPLLVQSALDAVRQWRYQPTLLNGEPVEVVTTIDVVFTLSS